MNLVCQPHRIELGIIFGNTIFLFFSAYSLTEFRPLETRTVPTVALRRLASTTHRKLPFLVSKLDTISRMPSACHGGKFPILLLNPE